MSTLSVALAHYRRRARMARALEGEAARLWRGVDRVDIARSWLSLMPQLLIALQAAQRAEAASADAYLVAILAEQGIDIDATGRINPDAFVGASDGRDMVTLLAQPVVTAKTALSKGRSQSVAMASGRAALQMIVATQLADAGRVADQVALTANRQPGYVRMVVGKTCSRCVVLAGRWYRWNQGFNRHPRCDCVHIPARENAKDLRTDPAAYFRSLSRAEQDRVFTKAGAEAIRDGADISRVVNARRGAAGLTPAGKRLTEAEKRAARRGLDRGRLQTTRVFGRELFITDEAITRRGINRPVRLMPESIYQLAGNNRDEAIRLLRAHGFIL